MNRLAGLRASRHESFLLAFFIAVVISLLGCVKPPVDTIVEISDGWLAMGTFFEIEVRVRKSRSSAVLDWVENSRAAVARYEKIYSRHDETSEVSQLNRRLIRDVGEPAAPSVSRASEVSEELFGLIRLAEELGRATNGAFDIRVNPERIDLDAISKGWVLDRLREDFVAQFPAASALLNFGQSSIIAIGDPDGRGWRLALESRDPTRSALGTVVLRNQALSMSSSMPPSELDPDETRTSHVIDPRSGRPVSGRVEAIVVSVSAAHADAWSTSLVVMGGLPDEAARTDSGFFEALWVDGAGSISRTPSWPGAD